MKLRLEISDEFEDEILIRCSKMTDEIKMLSDIVNNTIEENAELVLYSGNSEHYVPKNDILFFETCDKKTSAHTINKMYYTNYKLYELEQILSQSFIRVSKSCILNTKNVCSIIKNLTGASEVHFKNTPKKVYVSRMYYKVFREKINETRVLK